MSSMTYKGYAARIDYSGEDDCFVGHIVGINDIVGFHGDTVAELHDAFKKAVTGYLAACEKFGRKPQKPYSGNLGARVSPAIHARAAMAAEISGKSFNKFVGKALEAAADKVIPLTVEVSGYGEDPRQASSRHPQRSNDSSTKGVGMGVAEGHAYAARGRGVGRGIGEGVSVRASKKKTAKGGGGKKRRA